MKIKIEASQDEQEKVDALLDLLEKSKHRDPGDRVELLIPALKDAQALAIARGEQVRKEMLRRIKEVVG